MSQLLLSLPPLRLLYQANQVLQLLDWVFRVVLIALLAPGCKLSKPGANILFRGVVPLRIGLQAQVDTHLRVLLLAGRSTFFFPARALALVCRNRLRQFRRRVQLVIQSLNFRGAKKRLAPDTT